MDEQLHQVARDTAATLVDPDRKQLRFNDIVQTAKSFYENPTAGVIELVEACDRSKPDLYVAKSPMWQTLNTQYGWMLA
jgi:hypothetical protein